MVASAVQVPLKVKTETKFFQFMEWYETSCTTVNPDTGRKRKGNFKKFLMEEIEFLLSSGKVNELIKVAEEFGRQACCLQNFKQQNKTLMKLNLLNLLN